MNAKAKTLKDLHTIVLDLISLSHSYITKYDEFVFSLYVDHGKCELEYRLVKEEDFVKDESTERS